MAKDSMQQIIVSGVGGQGVLFLTRLLAETALDRGRSLLVSETHGMAQRGGNVISHVKVFQRDDPEAACKTSPLIRPGRADLLFALHRDGIPAHGHFIKPGGTVYRNDTTGSEADRIDATGIACALGAPVVANLVLLGFAAKTGGLFCTTEEIEATLARIAGRRLDISLRALRAGIAEAEARAASGRTGN